MGFFPFIFSFLYTRNWYTGDMELSRPRLFIFLGGVAFVLLGLLIVAFLQMPVTYNGN